MQKILVDLADKTYNIFIEKNILCKIPEMIKSDFNHNKYLIITDENVSELYLQTLIAFFSNKNIPLYTHVIPPGETSKSLKELEKIYDTLASNNFTRHDAIIGFGGGVVGDLSGFAASTYLRGLDFIQIPTTLLSQVDSSVGGKVAINLKQGKNLVGHFYQPKAVYIDTNVLETLSEREFKSGLSEIIKYACIQDKELYHQLLAYSDMGDFKRHIASIIKRCLEIKVKFVLEDERDTHLRMHLNFGHTIGHGVERYFDYSKYTHGEGVAIGMYYILLGASKLNLVPHALADKVLKVLNKYGMTHGCVIKDVNKLIAYIRQDKKSKGDYIHIVLLKEIGESYLYELKIDELEQLLLEVI